MTGDDAVTGDELIGHPEIAGTMGDELVELLEGAGIEQDLDAFAGGELAGGVLLLAPRRAASELGPPFQIRERFVWLHNLSFAWLHNLT